jgi:hypothetical protein
MNAKIIFNGLTIYNYDIDDGFVIEDNSTKDTIYLEKKHIPKLIGILKAIENKKNQIKND